MMLFPVMVDTFWNDLTRWLPKAEQADNVDIFKLMMFERLTAIVIGELSN
jgi:hypothetical protein